MSQWLLCGSRQFASPTRCLSLRRANGSGHPRVFSELQKQRPLFEIIGAQFIRSYREFQVGKKCVRVIEQSVPRHFVSPARRRQVSGLDVTANFGKSSLALNCLPPVNPRS